MKKVLVFILAIIFVGALVLVFKFFVFGREKSGGLDIDSSPRASVFIDGIQMGITPYVSQKIKSGEHLIKLVSEGDSSGQLSWEGKVIVSPIAMTVVKRVFGETEDRSSTLTISLEKIPSKKTSAIAVVSSPNNTAVRVDGETKGFSPVSLDNLPAKDYEVIVSAAGYEEKSFSTKAIAGYKVLAQVQLARNIDGIVESTATNAQHESSLGSTPATVGKPSPSVSPKTTPSAGESAGLLARPYVTIKDTPNGFLRVRSLPSITGAELAKVKTGAQLPYLNEKQEDVNKDLWYKVEYKTGEAGWVSGTYAELSE